MAAAIPALYASPIQTLSGGSGPATPSSPYFDENYEFSAPMYYDFENPSPIGSKPDAWFDKPLGDLGDVMFQNTPQKTPSKTPNQLQVPGSSARKSRIQLSAQKMLNLGSPTKTPIKLSTQVIEQQIAQPEPSPISRPVESVPVPDIKQNESILQQTKILESPAPVAAAITEKPSFSEVVKSAQKQKPDANQHIKINHLKQQTRPLQPKQQSNIAPSTRSQVFVKPVNPARLVGKIPVPQPSKPSAVAGVRATPSYQAPRARPATTRPKSPTRTHTVPRYAEKTPSFKARPPVRPTPKPVPVQPLSQALNRRVASTVSAPVRKPAVPTRSIQPSSRAAAAPRQPIRAPVQQKPAVPATSTRHIPQKQATVRKVVPVVSKRTQPHLPPSDVASPSRPMTYAEVAASPVRSAASFMRPTAAMEAKQRSTLKVRGAVDMKKQQQDELRQRMLSRNKTLIYGHQKDTPETLRRQREAKAPALTVPVTPPFLKRHPVRAPKSPMLTTAQREALEVARARQQFLEEQRRRREQWEKKKAAMNRAQ